MGGLSIWHWLVVGVIILLLFGKGRFSDMMGDVAKGIKSFKKGMAEEDEPHVPARRIEADRTTVDGTIDRTRTVDPEPRREP